MAHIWLIVPWPYYPVDCVNLGPACALPSAVPKRFFVGVLQAQARHRYAEDRTRVSALVMSWCRRGAGVGLRESGESGGLVAVAVVVVVVVGSWRSFDSGGVDPPQEGQVSSDLFCTVGMTI